MLLDLYRRLWLGEDTGLWYALITSDLNIASEGCMLNVISYRHFASNLLQQSITLLHVDLLNLFNPLS